MSSDTVIRARALGKCYHVYERPQDRLWQGLWRGRRRYYREFWALRGIDLDIRRGETVGIIGRNGSGKSTLLQLIAGTLSPSEGNVEVSGRLAALLELGSGFNPEFSGRENVFMNGALLGLSGEEIARRFEEIAAFADIGEFIDQPVKSYSSGMVVRLAFAVSVCVEPDILIVDEALAVGDLAFQLKCHERLRQLTDSGATLLFVSHDLAAVKAYCTRAVYLDRGRARAAGATGEVAELYMMDVRDEQKRALGGARQIRPKPALRADGGFAFGSAGGRILAAAFLDGGGNEALFDTGARVRLRVELEYSAALARPALSILIQDSRMIGLAGRYVALPPGSNGGTMRAVLTLEFDAQFNPGSYGITLGIVGGSAGRVDAELVEKQVGALLFRIAATAQAAAPGLFALPIGAHLEEAAQSA